MGSIQKLPTGEETLLDWYSDQRPLTVDIVGDFAGRELFAIHGESMIRHCLVEAMVDFDEGFQLLHAIHAVEKFLSDLKKRDCNFEVIFFRDLENACVPEGVYWTREDKSHLTRRILIQHLTRSDLDFNVLEFDSFDSNDCRVYLATHPIHFMLCHEAEGGWAKEAIPLRYLIWRLIDSGRSVGLINSIAWKSSKVFVPLLSGSESVLPDIQIDVLTPERKGLSVFSQTVLEEVSGSQLRSAIPSARERLAVAFCRVYLDANSKGDEVPEVAFRKVDALLLHMAALNACHIQDRNCRVPTAITKGIAEENADFLSLFCTTIQSLIENGCGLDDQIKWDLFDLIDGRMFLNILDRISSFQMVPGFPSIILNQAFILYREVCKGKFDGILGRLSPMEKSEWIENEFGEPFKVPVKVPAALPFSHDALDDLLRDVKVKEKREVTNPTAKLVFNDLMHWHVCKPVNTCKTNTRDKVPAWVEKRRQRQTQRRMADVISYAASLTNSNGKVFHRETIVVNPRGPKQGSSKAGPKPATGKLTQIKGAKKAPKKGGKESALLAAQKLNEEKALVKRNDALRLWAKKCVEFESHPNSINRYLKALEFQYPQSPGSHESVRPEVSLYQCQVLGRIWTETREGEDESSKKGLYLVSMMWNWLRDISKSKKCTPTIANAAQEMLKTLGMPPFGLVVGEPQRSVPFALVLEVFKNVSKLVDDHRILQLEHGGPYMDRRFDSRSDSRVPFEPDAWQRDVLDSIDENESLLVVAPTSAGKTFISFYAMKKVLEESDEGVLVYVAPTKALVNQIAAEIEARFSKTYRDQQGKSVWAIQTRDYRVNNPGRCQILVTVPHILQCILLAPTNAAGPNAWSRRVKRIIFDEVHCIGQADDGVVWEQLLLLAPCPIIALSATVGNPDELRDWLAMSQAQKGYRMKMIVHKVRYSELRKFIYKPPEAFIFEELARRPRLPVPGLDEGDGASPNFENRAALGDVNLEARDCLTLWKHMAKTFPKEQLHAEDGLNPLKVLPEVIEKSHIVEWEKGLKTALKKAMESSHSPLGLLQESLSGPQRKPDGAKRSVEDGHIDGLFPLACELHAQDALPALVFNYDRHQCELSINHILDRLQRAETTFKESDPAWQQKLHEFGQWKKQKEAGRENQLPNRSKMGERTMSKLDQAREEASAEISPWESFDPDAPLEQFSFAATKMMQRKEFDDLASALDESKVRPELVDALRRGLGVHHAGMNRRYRQIVEMLFRKGYLRLVVATGTLALGINMPCKTVVFSGDSVFLSPQNYRQASGRAGRRGFDLLGNVVFNGISRDRVHEIMSSRLPALKGQFAISTTLILRLFNLLHGTKNSQYAVDAVQALLSQTRLYLGGPDAEMSVKHHLRFSIEYLRRQNLLSAEGKPLNFSGLVSHLYFTENAVFAFHSLLRGGYFHELCKDIDTARERVLREMMVVLSHLFNRIPIQQKHKLLEVVPESSSDIFLERLPPAAESLLVRHNEETLSIFKDYVHSYINQHLADKPDRTLPLTKIAVGPEGVTRYNRPVDARQPVIRSPFASLSGLTDDFQSIKELCSTVRDGVFLEESAIPYIPIWPHDTDVELNAYLYDFFKHGSLKVLVRDNRIKEGDVWFHLKDFWLTLRTIAASLKGVVSGTADDFDADKSDTEEGSESAPESVVEMDKSTEANGKTLQPAISGRRRARVLDSWEDASDDESDPESAKSDSAEEAATHAQFKGGLVRVMKAFSLLEQEFGRKFYQIGA
ncbi:hypothetical protein ACJ41O_005113 [Fusarium nematophilum]